MFHPTLAMARLSPRKLLMLHPKIATAKLLPRREWV